MAESEIRVEPYDNIAFGKAWSKRSHGYWGVSAVGLALGAAVGLIAPFFPALAGVQDFSAAAELIPKSVIIFSALGMGTGFAAGAVVGVSSGGPAGVANEQERRLRERDIALGITTPEVEAQLSRKLEAEPDTRSGWQKFKDGLDTYVNLKVGTAMALFGMVGGAVMAAAFFALKSPASSALPGMEALLGPALATNQTAITAYFVGMMGTFGALWALNVPEMANKAQAFAGRLIGGELLDTQWGPAKEKAPQPEIASAPEPACGCPHKKFASFQEMVSVRGQGSAADIQPGI